MKYVTLTFFFLVCLNCFGQSAPSLDGEGTKRLSKSSVSLTCGTNIVYPIVPSIPYTPWGGSGLLKIRPLLSLAYSYLFHSASHFSLGIKLGTAFAQYDYAIPGELTYFEQEINEAEIYTGLFANTRISRKIGWYNEFDVSLSGPIQGNSVAGYWILSDLPYGNYSNLFLVYQTGISFYVGKNFMLTPFFCLSPNKFCSALRQCQSGILYCSECLQQFKNRYYGGL